MSRRAVRRFLLAGVAFALALWIAVGRGNDRLDRPAAEALAGRLLEAYVRASGEPAAHFAPRPTVSFRDGWEFRWAYSPCPELAELRLFVSRSGRADFAETPDCAAPDTLAAPPVRA